MVIVELIGSISLAIACVGGLALAIVHFQARHHQLECPDDRPLAPTAPFSTEIVHVVSQDETCSPSRRYGIQWTLPSVDVHDASTEPHIPSSDIDKRDEFNQGDSVSFSDQTTSVKDLIEKFENHHSNSTRKMNQGEK